MDSFKAAVFQKIPPLFREKEKKRTGVCLSVIRSTIASGLDGLNDLAENVANGGAEDRQDDDDHDGNEHEDQRVLHQALPFLLHLEHGFFLLSLKNAFHLITSDRPP